MLMFCTTQVNMFPNSTAILYNKKLMLILKWCFSPKTICQDWFSLFQMRTLHSIFEFWKHEDRILIYQAFSSCLVCVIYKNMYIVRNIHLLTQKTIL